MERRDIEELKEQIHTAASLTDIIAGYTSVRGKMAQCPLHSDKTPSLSISNSKCLWHCFSCGASGDVFTFVMTVEGISFPEAVTVLCKRYGITQSYDSPQEAEAAKRRTDLRKSIILDLKQQYERKLTRLNDHDLVMGALWKKVHKSNSVRREAILEAIETCFVILDEKYKQLERWYENARKKIYRKIFYEER